MPAILFEIGDNHEFIIESIPSLAYRKLVEKNVVIKTKYLKKLFIIVTLIKFNTLTI